MSEDTKDTAAPAAERRVENEMKKLNNFRQTSAPNFCMGGE